MAASQKQPVRLKVSYKTPGALLSEFTRSIGKGNVSIESGRALPIGTRFVFELHAHGVDFTLSWRRLADAAAGDEAALRALFAAGCEVPARQVLEIASPAGAPMTSLIMPVLARCGRGKGAFKWLPLASGWTASRDLPSPEGRTFQAQWKRRQR